MLVLSRMPGEKILIGNDIIITYVADDRGRGRIGIEAPQEVSIRRAELCGTDIERMERAIDDIAAHAHDQNYVGSKITREIPNQSRHESERINR